MKVTIVIPSYNEGKRLTQVIKSVRKVSDLGIVVVDDGSTPAEKEITGATVLRHAVNLGKGAAMKTGAEFAFGKGAQAVIFMDADRQHDPAELPKFTKYLGQGFDVVFGSRNPGLSVPLVRLLGNKLASIYMNIMFDIYISDILSGYRALTLKAYKLLKWTSRAYGVESEMVARLGKNKNKLKYTEFPIEAIYIDKYKGVSIIDAVKILINSLWWKLY